MTVRERMKAVLNGEPADRMPVIEWATWWDKTLIEWEKQGLKPGKSTEEICDYYGLDPLRQIWINHKNPLFPEPKVHGGPIVTSLEEYHEVKKNMFSIEKIDKEIEYIKKIKPNYEKGDFSLWFTLEGFFWFPRTLLGIKEHLFAFYDDPELIHQINKDQLEFSIYVVERICKEVQPEFMTFAEDMSYNNGPMLSKQMYDEFMKPYYLKIIPVIKKYGVKVLIDTDGNVEPLIPWFKEVGIEGVLPLERQAGVDVTRIRSKYDDFILIGGYDKTIMHKGEEAMRIEFERISNCIQTGRYVASVDHQTPPDVPIETYKTYVRLLKEYAAYK